MRPKVLSAALALTFCAAPAHAQEFVRPDCGAALAATGSLPYESAQHARWYRRFWTGSCQDLPVLQCVPGNPNWNDVVSKLVKKGGAGQARSVTQTACRMGQTIGHEWARAKPVRRITTADLKTYTSTLDSAPDVAVGLARVDALVKTAMAGPPKGR